MESFILIMAGAAGAMVKDLVKDNKLILPKYHDGCLLMGFLGGMVIGAAVGYVVDQNPTTAFFSGYAGSQMLAAFVPKTKEK